MAEVSVQAFIEHVAPELPLEVLAGARGVTRMLRSPRIQKPGLALVGYTSFVHPDRVQILGETEISYLGTLDPEVRDRGVRALVGCDVACLLVTKGIEVPASMVEACEQRSVPLLRTQVTSSVCIRKILTYLEDLLSPRTRLHGVLVDVDGVGVLITGSSGIGKSECALDLVLRGHRLVADDVVEIRRRGDDLVGQASPLIKHLIEIRGLGILNVAELYGVAATRDHKKLEMHIELEMWRADRGYDRVGLDERHRDILGVHIQSRLLPVRPGRDIASIVEVAARNFLLGVRGHNAAQALSSVVDAELAVRPGVRAPTTLDLRRASGLIPAEDHIEDEVE